jgi:Protein of unknown function (DUF1403)
MAALIRNEEIREGPRPLPAWARASDARVDASDCALYAGAALSALDPIVRANAPFDGVWRHRLALRAASFPVEEIFALVGNAKGTPVRAAAHTAAAVSKLNPAAEFLGLWLADVVLARGLRWPQPVPLLATKISDPSIRRAADARTCGLEDESWQKLVALAYAQSAASAIDLAGDLSRRANKLLSQRAKLRAKGAGKVVDTLLQDDAFAPDAAVAETKASACSSGVMTVAGGASMTGG